MVMSLPSYIYYTGTYMHTLIIYAFSNIDDLTWGTKGLSSEGKGPFYEGKVTWVGKWLFSNAVGAFVLTMLNKLD